MKVALVACGKKKSDAACRAQDLYLSTLFKESAAYAGSIGERWYILSAKHGLIEPDTVIAPYDETLNDKTTKEINAWADMVVRQLSKAANITHIVILGGKNYHTPLAEKLSTAGYRVEIPLQNLSLGKRIQKLQELNRPIRRGGYVETFYSILSSLDQGLLGGRILSQCNGRLEWPAQGVYFFFEPNEFRGQTRCSRVVRIGTHAVSAGSKTTLWNRLSTHRGTEAGGGNHRSSIFRLHVGAALINRAARNAEFPTWGVGQSAGKEILNHEVEVEALVTAHIGQMKVLWINVPGKSGPASDRAYLERNIIALLTPSAQAVDQPSSSWLGHFSPSPLIRSSGLWNLNHVGEAFDPASLDVLAQYVQFTVGQVPAPAKPLAPSGWRRERQEARHVQLRLL